MLDFVTPVDVFEIGALTGCVIRHSYFELWETYVVAKNILSYGAVSAVIILTVAAPCIGKRRFSRSLLNS
jgi:hypothetical protein